MDTDGILQWLMNQLGGGPGSGSPSSGASAAVAPSPSAVQAPSDGSLPALPSQTVATQPIQNPAMAVTPPAATTPAAPQTPAVPGATTPTPPNKQNAYSNLTSNGLSLMKMGAPMQMGGGGGGVHQGQTPNLLQLVFGLRNNNQNQY